MPILTPEERVGSTMAGKYRLDGILATGGMATVFAGVHAWTEREVAVKILNYEHARDPEIVRRFLQEARAAAQLKHPNVVDVLDMGQDTDGTVYLVLERLHGETLKARMKRGTLSLREVGATLLPVMRGVASAHAKKVVHRDLKPDNIFLASGEGGVVTPKLLDFGIAKVASGDSGSTRTGLMVGTPSYMSPEQVRGERDVGPRADVWSMGVVLHAALTGRVPFEGESSAAVLARVITERARPILTIAPALRPSVAAVVDRALTFEPAERFADMGEMVLALETALDGPSEGSRAPGERAAPTPVSRAPLPAIGGFTDTPTVQLDARDLDQPTSPAPPASEQNAAMLPAATPFAWAAAPDAPPPPSAPSRLPWVVGALVAATLALAGVGYGLVRTEPTVTPLAAPVPVALPLPSAAGGAGEVTGTGASESESESGSESARGVDTVSATVAPDAGTGAAAETPAETPRVRTPRTTTEGAESRPHAPRTPRRGTGGALILH